MIPTRTLVLCLCTAGAALAATPLTIEQAMQVREPSDLQFSPDGKKVALVLQEPVNGRSTERHVWVYDLAAHNLRQWTRSSKTESMPRWSPDGRYLAFLSDRDETAQIFLMPLNGGEAFKLTSARNAVESFKWSRDGKQIAFLASDPKTDDDDKKQKAFDDARNTDVDRKPSRAWTVDVESKAARRVTSGPWHLHEIELTPDGKRLVAIATDRPTDDRRTERLFTVALDDGRITELLDPKGPIARIQVSPAGSAVAYTASPEDGPSSQDLYICSLETKSARNTTGPIKDRPVLSYQWLNDSELAVLYLNGFHTELDRVGGTQRKLVTDDTLDVTQFHVSPSGSVAYVAESAAVLPELYAEGKPVSHFNAALSLTRPEFFRYNSFDGQPVEAALYRGAAQPGPLVVLIHGGPAGSWRNRFDGLTQLLVSRGYSVMQPNIRGSVGYGQKFLTANRGDWGGGDFKDVMAGVDDLVHRNLADPARLAIGGWSYGGYMAEWAITQTDRFKAAISGAGMADLAAEFGTELRSAGDEWYYGTPYENLAGFQKSSPITFIKNAKTPTLILQGEADTTDPLGQSQMLFRGLKRYNVPTELIVYPREPHGLREQKHLADRFTRQLAWIEKYLGPATH